MEPGTRPFDKSLRRTLAFSLGLILVAGVGLIVTSRLAADEVTQCRAAASEVNAVPLSSESTFECVTVSDGGWSPDLAVAVSSVFSAILAVGAVSLVADFALRKRFGADLLSFLGLKGSLVGTGLADAGRSTSVDLRSRLDGLDELRYLGRSPTTFLNEQIPALLRLAEQRKLSVTLGLPDPQDDELMAIVARSLGLEPDLLRDAIRAFTRSLEANWQTVLSRLVIGTSFRVVYVSVPVPFDACSATSFSFLAVGKPFEHGTADDHFLTVFESTDQFPGRWIADSLAGLDAIPAAWEDSKR